MGAIMEETGAYVWLTHEPPVAIYPDWIGGAVSPSGSLDFTQMTHVG